VNNIFEGFDLVIFKMGSGRWIDFIKSNSSVLYSSWLCSFMFSVSRALCLSASLLNSVRSVSHSLKISIYSENIFL
jgi:hypothetical protein